MLQGDMDMHDDWVHDEGGIEGVDAGDGVDMEWVRV